MILTVGGWLDGRSRRRVWLVASVAGAWLLSQSSVAGASAGVNWGAGVKVPVPAGAAANPGVVLNTVSCPSARNCVAVGQYLEGSGQQGLLLSENSGTLIASKPSLPADAATTPGANVASVSCVSAGTCSAVGIYNDGSHYHGLLLSESSGVWGDGVKAILPARGLNVVLPAVSCASAGNCVAVGTYFDRGTGGYPGVIVTEGSGTWGAGFTAPLPADASILPDVTFTSISCTSPGNCVAVGNYTDTSGNTQGLLLSESSGAWLASKGTAPVGAATNPNTDLNSVSCASAGNCAAVGQYIDSSSHGQVVVFNETSGTWGTGIKGSPPPTGTNPFADLTSVSCPLPGNCAAVGLYLDGSGNQQGMTFRETAGTWGAGVKTLVPAGAAGNPNAELKSVSCTSPGNCAAAGGYTDHSGNGQALLVSETSGTWGTGVKAVLPAGAPTHPQVFLNSISCASVGNCATVSDYIDGSGDRQGLLVQAAPVSPMLSVRAPAKQLVGSRISPSSVAATLSAGSAPTGKLTFIVFGPLPSALTSCSAGGTIVGTANVIANGTYHPSAGFSPTHAGDYWWYARYSGDTTDNPTSSACGPSMAKTAVVPVTAITKAKIHRKHHSASFAFKASAGAIGFQCALIGPHASKPRFVNCQSPKTYKHLKARKHTFEVRAMSTAGPGPVAQHQFTI
jgi:hypothetical protein